MPEGLPLAVTIALAFSVKKMLKDQNLVLTHPPVSVYLDQVGEPGRFPSTKLTDVYHGPSVST